MDMRVKIAKFFTMIVALQLLNMSIYNSEFELNLRDNTTSATFDETDSFIEFFSENILHHKNQDADYSNAHSKSQLHKHIQVKVFPPDAITIKIERPQAIVKQFSDFIINYNFLFYKEINPPPPKQALA